MDIREWYLNAVNTDNPVIYDDRSIEVKSSLKSERKSLKTYLKIL